MTNDDERGQKGPAPRDIHRVAAIAKLLEGGSVTEIAKELGLSRQHVSTIINDEVGRKLIKQSEAEIASLQGTAVSVLKKAMESSSVDMTNALKAAIAVLKNSGLLKENMNVLHSIKPFVIEKSDGTSVILGAKGEDDE